MRLHIEIARSIDRPHNAILVGNARIGDRMVEEEALVVHESTARDGVEPLYIIFSCHKAIRRHFARLKNIKSVIHLALSAYDLSSLKLFLFCIFPQTIAH